MDTKLKDALESKDYYSAHQIYLAIAQRHCRSKRFEEAKQILKDGCLELCGRGECKSAFDLGRRYIDTLALGRLPLIDIDAIGVHSVLIAIGKRSGTDKDNLKAISDLVIKEHPYLLLIVFHSLLQVGAHKEAGLVLLRLDDAKEEWQLLGAATTDPHVVLSLTLAGLRARNFAAISTFLANIVDVRFPQSASSLDSPSEDLPSFIKVISGDLQGDEDVLARCLNFCQILFVLFQHRLIPTPSALTKPLQHYAGLLAKLRVSEEEIKSIEHSYLLQQQQESGASGMGAGRPDLLANLFQSMMAQSAGSPTGLPKRK